MTAALQRKGGEIPFDHHPLLAIWEVTQACELACAHCRACATPMRDLRELSTDEGKKLLEDVRAMGTPLVVLTGGDPAARPDLVELVSHGTSLGLIMAVTPSGTPSTTRELLVELRGAGLKRLAVSVDGPDPATHDAFRGVEGSFDESVRILRTAREIGLQVQVNTTVAPHNAKSLRRMADFARDVGAVLWSVFVVVPTGRAGRSLLLGPKALERLLEELAEIARDAPFDVKTTGAPHYRRVLLEQHAKRDTVGVLHDVDEHGVVRGVRGITDGVGFVFVSHLGDIYPSGFLPLKTGNVREDDLATVYRSHPLFRELRTPEALQGKCGACSFKRVCGGSRARGYAVYGNPMAEDPLCAYVPKGWQGAPFEPAEQS